MNDRIEVRGIRAWGRHGVDPGEQDVPQPFDVDLDVELDLAAARRSDALAATIDYAALRAAVVRIVAEHRFALLERLGEEILADLMRDRRITHARVAIAKPNLLAGATPVVTVHRTR